MTLRAFIDPAPKVGPGDELTLCADESHYLIRVRRAKQDTGCELLDRQGRIFQARITRPNAKACGLLVEQVELLDPIAPPLELWLGMPDTPALLAALARATELGATRVLLLRTRYTQGRLPSPPRIARCLDAAMRQCGRPRAPALEGPTELVSALAAPWSGRSWLAAPDAPKPAQALERLESAQRVAIGPEGGFSKEEQAQLQEAGFLPLGLGPFVLRSEVAVTAALAKLNHPQQR